VPLRLSWAGRLFAESENKKGDRDYFLPVTQINKEKSAQEDNNSAATKKHFSSHAVRRSLALSSHFRDAEKPGEGFMPPVRAKPENCLEMLDRSRRALLPAQV
jgi:hypothetical protein